MEVDPVVRFHRFQMYASMVVESYELFRYPPVMQFPGRRPCDALDFRKLPREGSEEADAS